MENIIAKNLLLGRECNNCIHCGHFMNRCDNTKRVPTIHPYEQNNNCTIVNLTEILQDIRGTCEFWE